jgi:hypothetical protein
MTKKSEVIKTLNLTSDDLVWYVGQGVYDMTEQYEDYNEEGDLRDYVMDEICDVFKLGRDFENYDEIGDLVLDEVHNQLNEYHHQRMVQ